ncbi:MAG: hypothetical protein ORN57_00495, partial [Alphaproteobacteria bacterium]|nr:hypothetical protein [Alphaproteobacteria bacterium]
PWRLAVARDLAFGFIYPHQLVRWRRQGLAVDFFSPLADDAPNSRADGLFLPGGYPELYLPALARARHFRRGVAQLAARNKIVYGECGGYMMLGRSITNAAGRAYPALDLLPVSTSFAAPRLTLGYRVMEPQQRHLSIAQQHFLRQVMGDGAMTLQGHEFHYCTERMADQPTRPLFRAFDANHQPLPSLGGESMAGAVHGSVMGSFLHVI